MSSLRVRRTSTRTLSVAAAVVATVALLATGSGGSGGSGDPSSASAVSDTASTGGEAVVIDQPHLLLQTAQQTLEARGLVVQVTDASGRDRDIEDPTQWVVVTQDPTSGTVGSGTEVTLTVRMTTDPVS